jgi:hypothetical protein
MHFSLRVCVCTGKPVTLDQQNCRRHKKKESATMAKTDESSAPPRLEKTTACLPIVYGSVAFYLGTSDEFQTHQWTLYVRGPNREDLSCCIEKVVFQLHPSFAQSTRELTEPPFEVTERGWGEFEAQIRIFWKDPQEKTTLVSTISRLMHLTVPPILTALCFVLFL